MRRINPFYFILFYGLMINACGTKQVENSGSNGKGNADAQGGRNIQVPPVVIGIDESVDTKWVDVIPPGQDLVTLSGHIGITGNEPFIKVVIYESKDTFYALSGNEQFMNYITGYQNQEITIGGYWFEEDGIKWLKVEFVKNKLSKK